MKTLMLYCLTEKTQFSWFSQWLSISMYLLSLKYTLLWQSVQVFSTHFFAPSFAVLAINPGPHMSARPEYSAMEL
jgi:hypothetical protein